MTLRNQEIEMDTAEDIMDMSHNLSQHGFRGDAFKSHLRTFNHSQDFASRPALQCSSRCYQWLCNILAQVSTPSSHNVINKQWL